MVTTRGHRYKGGTSSLTLGHEFVARVDKLNIDTASKKQCHGASAHRKAVPQCPKRALPHARTIARSRVRHSRMHLRAHARTVTEGQRVVAEINCVADSCGCRDYHERAQHPERKALGIFGECSLVQSVPVHACACVPRPCGERAAYRAIGRRQRMSCPRPAAAAGSRVSACMHTRIRSPSHRNLRRYTLTPNPYTLPSGADGAFAEYAIVPIINIHPVPALVTDDQAMFAEPLAAACQITQQVCLVQF